MHGKGLFLFAHLLGEQLLLFAFAASHAGYSPFHISRTSSFSAQETAIAQYRQT